MDVTEKLSYVAGWGSTSYCKFYNIPALMACGCNDPCKLILIKDEPPSSVLMEVQVPVVSQVKCAQAYRAYGHVRIDQSVLCAGMESGGKDACRVKSNSNHLVVLL